VTGASPPNTVIDVDGMPLLTSYLIWPDPDTLLLLQSILQSLMNSFLAHFPPPPGLIGGVPSGPTSMETGSSPPGLVV